MGHYQVMERDLEYETAEYLERRMNDDYDKAYKKLVKIVTQPLYAKMIAEIIWGDTSAEILADELNISQLEIYALQDNRDMYAERAYEEASGM